MGGEMSVQAVLGKINLPADEPFRERRFQFQHFSPSFLPNQLVRLARPEFVGALDRLLIHPLILGEILDPCLLRKFLRRLEDALFLEVRFDISVVDFHYYQS